MYYDGSNRMDKRVFPRPWWAHKILPLVYDDSLSYYEAIMMLQQKVNEVISAIDGSVGSTGDAILKGKKVLVVGDELAYGEYENVGKGWGYYFRQITQCDMDGVYQIGGGFATASTGVMSTFVGKNFADGLYQFALTKSDEDREQYAYVVIGGGKNDLDANVVTLRKQVESIVNSAKTYFPNAIVVVLPLIGASRSLGYSATRRCCIIAEASAHSGCKSCDDSWKWFLSRTDTFRHETDVHSLNDLGYQYTANYVYSFICGWDGELVLPFYDVTFPAWLTKDLFDGYCDNGIVHLHFECTFSSVQYNDTFQKGDEIPLCYLGEDIAVPARVLYLPCVINSWGTGGAGLSTGTLKIDTDGTIWLRVGNEVRPTGSEATVRVHLIATYGNFIQ